MGILKLRFDIDLAWRSYLRDKTDEKKAAYEKATAGFNAALVDLAGRLPFPIDVAHAYTPRETGSHGGGNHIITQQALNVGKLKRSPGDALCKPSHKFWGLDGGRGVHAINCKRCLEIAERLAAAAADS